MSDTLHIAGPDDAEGFALARLISQLGVRPESPSTFLWEDCGDLDAAWSLWLEKWFAPHLVGAFIDVYQCATRFRLDEIQAVDTLLDVSLTESLRMRSLKAATAFREGKSEMRANREWQHFIERIERRESPGHTTTLFALQCALYHLPLAPALSAYVWFELESGLPRSGSSRTGDGNGYRDKPGSAAEVLAVFRTALPHVSVALRGVLDETGRNSSHLRAI